jgi:OOP family OmpA-OmpF porin
MIGKARPWLACALVLTVLVGAVAPSATAQSVAERLRQRAKERADSKVDQALESALNKLENTVNCLASDAQCIAKAKRDKKEVKTFTTERELAQANEKQAADVAQAKADVDAKPSTTGAPDASVAAPATAAPAAQQGARPGDAAWANFDFVPGERVLFADDFSRDRVGNFPQRLQLIEGNAQVVESEGKRWLQATSSPTIVAITLPEVLPRRFTIEFDLTLAGGFPTKVSTQKSDDADPNSDSPFTYAYFGAFSSGLIGGSVKAEVVTRIGGQEREALAGVMAKGRLHADGDYTKVYLNEMRIANVPSAKFGRSKQLFVALFGSTESPVMIGGFTVAAGGRGLYDALLADGRVATQGILFDTGSDRIRAESGPTLKQIGDMLTEHAELKLLIEGHTDNVGAAASNLSLSDKRAAAVKAYLVGTYRIDAARLTTKGFGDTKPAAPNTTGEGRQQNRRVELVKQP